MLVPSAEADSEKEINGLDAGLKTSSTRSLPCFCVQREILDDIVVRIFQLGHQAVIAKIEWP